jgi:tetratricopeptide (TPR) repeat protein
MRGSAGIFGLFVIVAFLISSALAAETLTNDAVVAMVKAGLGEELIISKVKVAEGKYDLSVDGTLMLKRDGVSEAIIKAMVETSALPAAAPSKSAEAPAKETQAAVALYRQDKGAEAATSFDKLLAERPNDEDLRIWKALALLEQARAMKDVNAAGYKPLVTNAYRILQPALYKLGVMSAELEGKPAAAREYWQRATDADPACRYGVLAQEKLKRLAGK